MTEIMNRRITKVSYCRKIFVLYVTVYLETYPTFLKFAANRMLI